MDANERLLLEALRLEGFELIRQKRHRVFKQAHSGKIWVVPVSPSDHHAYINNLEQFRRFLAIGVAKAAAPKRDRSESALAEKILHPDRARQRRERKARRFVQKRLAPPVVVTSAARPVVAQQPEKKFKAPDAYQIRSRLLIAFDKVIRVMWTAQANKEFEAAKEPAFQELEAIEAAGAKKEAIIKRGRELWSIARQRYLRQVDQSQHFRDFLATLFQKSARFGYSKANDHDWITATIEVRLRKIAPPWLEQEGTIYTALADFFAQLGWQCLDIILAGDTPQLEIKCIGTANEDRQQLDWNFRPSKTGGLRILAEEETQAAAD